MLGKIQDELAKMIATEIYTFGKKKASQVPQVLKDLQTTTLRPSGVGLPPPLLVAFHESFLGALDARNYSRDGYASWTQGNGEQKFKLLLREPLVARIQQTDWVKAANQTADGVKQIQALGGPNEYQAAISDASGQVFDYAVSKYVGEFRKSSSLGTGWRLLTEVIKAPAACARTTNFQDTEFLYWSTGTERETADEYKLAKKIMTSGSLWWKKNTPTSSGPFLDA
jgi:hypothetical protein